MLEGFNAVAILLGLGFNLEPKFHTGPEARYKASFCSSLFYPCNDPSGKEVVVLAPKIGRTYAKIGWYCNPQPNIDMNRIMRGDALGRQKDCSMLPCIRHSVDKVIQLTGHIKNNQIYRDKSMLRKHAFEHHCGQIYTPSEHTYKMTNIVYGITKQHDEEYRRLVNTVVSLPTGLNFPILKTAACIDGSLTGLAASEIESIFNTSSTTPPLPMNIATQEHDLPNGHDSKSNSNKKEIYRNGTGLKGGVKTHRPPEKPKNTNQQINAKSTISKKVAPSEIKQSEKVYMDSSMVLNAKNYPELFYKDEGGFKDRPSTFSFASTTLTPAFLPASPKHQPKSTILPIKTNVSSNNTAMVVDPVSPTYCPQSPKGYNAHVAEYVPFEFPGLSPSSPVRNPFVQKNVDDTMLELALDLSRVDIKEN
jgi:hypothetical protein